MTEAGMTHGVNAAQAERWNGDTGRRWVAQRERHAALRQPLTPHLLRAAAVVPGDQVLDVGCGCGETTVALARSAGPDGSVLGLDLSAAMLAVAHHLAAESTATTAAGSGAGAAAPAAIRFVRGDAQTYPLPAAAFDAVVSSFGVMFFEDPHAAFANLRAALRPGGRLAFLTWQDDEHKEVFGLPVRAFAAHAGPPDPAGDDLFADPRRVTALLAGAGFVDVSVEAVHGPARIGSDVADVLGYVRATSRIRDLLAGVEEPRRVLAAMAEEYAARQRPDGVWVDAAAWLVTAARAPTPPLP
jgi:SAM-dependent methyltransferase